ncbi:MAG: DUF1788 domain-containing protein [Chloroflexi bacterium]|nr:DUF1788 domain-containing protein [Chloroflexota bacterium]
MSELEALLEAYGVHAKVRWPTNVAAEERVWFIVYSPQQERRIRRKFDEFALVTTEKADRRWRQVDVTSYFADWMATHEYRDAYFQRPEAMALALDDFADDVVDRVREELNKAGPDDVVALTGLGSLFGLTRVSRVITDSMGSLRGWLLVFFPGTYDEPSYRLLDSREAWNNYLGVPITAR